MEQSIKSVLVKQTIAHQQQQLTNLQVRPPAERFLPWTLCPPLTPKVEPFYALRAIATALRVCLEPGTSASVSPVKLKCLFVFSPGPQASLHTRRRMELGWMGIETELLEVTQGPCSALGRYGLKREVRVLPSKRGPE